MDLREALTRLSRRFAHAGLTDADLEAEVLLRHVLGMDRAQFYASLGDRALSREEARRLESLTRRRLGREPLFYLLGRREFYGLDFLVNKDVLIPRQETELLVELAIERAREFRGRSPLIADVGTGSGAIAVALARHLPEARIVATDVSAATLAVARANIRRHGVDGQVHLVRTHLLDGIGGPIDVIVANLPYIPSAELEKLAPEVLHEPRLALDGGPDGLSVVSALLRRLPSVAAPDAVAILEIAPYQRHAAEALARSALPGAHLRFHRDAAGRYRAVELYLSVQRPQRSGVGGGTRSARVGETVASNG